MNKTPITFVEAIQNTNTGTGTKLVKVKSIDGDMAYVVPVSGSAGHYATVSGNVTAGSIVSESNIKGTRTISGTGGEVSSKTAAFSSSGGTISAIADWTNIVNKPATFPPSSHMQDWGTITNQPTTDYINEGLTNQYFTVDRVRYSVSATMPITYSSGVFGLDQSGITHNNLSGLTTGDPHLQYFPIDGSRALAGPISSSTFVSSSTGWRIDTGGIAEMDSLALRSSLHVSSFVNDLISTTIGSQIIAKSAGTLAVDMTVPIGFGWTMVIKDAPGSTAMLLSANDIIKIKLAVSGTVQTTWFTVNAGIHNSNGTQSYTCTWISGMMDITYGAGGAIVDYGTSGQGYIYMSATDANGPFIDVRTHAGTPWSLETTQVRLGKLSGIVDSAFGTLSGYGLYSQNVYLRGTFNLAGTVGGVLNINTTGGIWQGSSGTFASPGTGYKLYNPSGAGVWETWNSGVKQVYIDSTDMSLRAGGGNVKLDADGTTIYTTGDYRSSAALKFITSPFSTTSLSLWGANQGPGDASTIMSGGSSATSSTDLLLTSKSAYDWYSKVTIMATRNGTSISDAATLNIIANPSSGPVVESLCTFRADAGINIGSVTTGATGGALKAAGDGTFGGGLNVGTATGATTGQVKASGDMFASGKGVGLQAQITDNHLQTLTGNLNLTTAYQPIPNFTYSITPTSNLLAEVDLYVGIAQWTGTAPCNAGDQITMVVSAYYSNADHFQFEAGYNATGNAGHLLCFRRARFILNANTPYTIRGLVKNSSGARGTVDWPSWMDVKFRAA